MKKARNLGTELVALAFSIFIGVMLAIVTNYALDLVFPGDTVWDYDVGGKLAAGIIAAVIAAGLLFGSARVIKMPVISDGLLFGGIFVEILSTTILWSYSEGESFSRLLTMLFSLAFVVVAGYLRFEYTPKRLRMPKSEDETHHPDVCELEGRVSELEDKLASLKNVL